LSLVSLYQTVILQKKETYITVNWGEANQVGWSESPTLFF